MRIIIVYAVLSSISFFSCQSESKTDNNTKPEQTQVITTQNPNDLVVKYYSNGQMKYSQQYLNGIKHGQYNDWYKNGVIRTSGFYQMGMRSGLWQWYDEKGGNNYQINYGEALAQM